MQNTSDGDDNAKDRRGLGCWYHKNAPTMMIMWKRERGLGCLDGGRWPDLPVSCSPASPTATPRPSLLYLYTAPISLLLYPNYLRATQSHWELNRANQNQSNTPRPSTLLTRYGAIWSHLELLGATWSYLKLIRVNQSWTPRPSPILSPSYISLESRSYLDLLRTTWS